MSDVVLYSGGPDSLITYYWCKSKGMDPKAVYFRLGHRYQQQEQSAVVATIPDTMVSNVLCGLGAWEEENANLYARNAFLVIAGSRFLDPGEPGRVWLSVQKHELEIPDRSVGFLEKISSLVGQLQPEGAVSSPWLYADKTEMVKWYLGAGMPKDLLVRTRSCYQVSQVHCGGCPACVRRFIAFAANDVPTMWIQRPDRSPMADTYRQRAKEGMYPPERCKRILEVLGNEAS